MIDLLKKHESPLLFLVGLVLLSLCAYILFWPHAYEASSQSLEHALYKDPTQPIDERIQNLLSYMTLEEKIGQMALIEKNSVNNLADLGTYGVGGVLSGAGGKPKENTPQGWTDMVSSYSTAAGASRLGIPLLYGVDANHGHGNVPGATIFPHQIGLGATGDAPLVEAIGEATAKELSATGIYWNFSPSLDLPADIRWGRVYESFTDDPVLAGELGAAYVRGLQGISGENIFVLATPKHYIGAGSMVWGSSSNENFFIDQGVTLPDERLLREVHLPPFQSAIAAGAQSIMVGLNGWGDKKVSSSKYLIHDVLKGELGFSGFAVSDWYGVYEIPGGEYEATVLAINAGVDMIMLPFDYKMFVQNVRTAVMREEVPEARIDDAVRRILRAKFALGLFEGKRHELPDVIGSADHRALARDAVAKSLVLLKNDAVLPFDENVRHIRVAGSAADNVGMQSGAWTVEWQGIDGNWLPGGTSILEGLKEVADENTRIEYSKDGIFSGTATADVGIAVVGEAPYAEGWGDNATPALGAEDLAAIERLRLVSSRTVVVLVTGRPLIITDELSKWDALVVAWLPGSEGGGVADVLFGKNPVSGALPLPWPASIRQLPISKEGTTVDGTDVLFERGFRLQY